MVSMQPERNIIPEWARKERQGDFGWIRENLDSFWPLAKSEFEQGGRGAILVDTTSQSSGGGHPYGYMTEADMELYDFGDTNRMLGEYDPEKEFVIVLWKSEDRISTYRIKPLQRNMNQP